MADREAKIRAKAHELWEAAGCPEGQAEVHWHEAERLVAEAEAREDAPPAPHASASKPDAERPGIDIAPSPQGDIHGGLAGNGRGTR